MNRRHDAIVEAFLADSISELIYQLGKAVGYREGVEAVGKAIRNGQAAAMQDVNRNIEVRTEQLRTAILNIDGDSQ